MDVFIPCVNCKETGKICSICEGEDWDCESCVTCSECEGRGQKMVSIDECFECGGAKTVECDCTGMCGPEHADPDCFVCSGSGKCRCPVCDGVGYNPDHMEEYGISPSDL